MADNNIALGVKQPEPVNYLGQMAQAMALRAAQNEMQDNEALRQFYIQGGDASTPEGQRQLRMVAPKASGAIIHQGLQNKKIESDISTARTGDLEKQLKIIKDQTGMVPRTQEAAAAFMTGVFGTPGVGEMLSKYVTLDKALAAIPTDPTKIHEYLGNFSKSAENMYQSENNRQTNLTSVQTTGMNNATSLATNKNTVDNAWRMHQSPNLVPVAGDTIDANGNRVPTYMGFNPKANTFTPAQMNSAPVMPPPGAVAGAYGAGPVAAPAPVAASAPVAAAPIAAPGVSAAVPSISAAATNPANNLAPTIANVNALTAKPAPAAGAFVPKLTPTEEKMALDKENKAKAKGNVETMIGKLYDAYAGLSKSGGIVDTTKPGMDNLGAGIAASGPGQYVGKMTGSPDQGLRNTVDTTRPLLLAAIKEATGMSAKAMDSNVELQFYLKSATDPSLDIKTNIDALNTLSKMYGLGKELPMPEGAQAPARDKAPAASSAPSVGTVSKGYKFKGGDPASPSSWEKQ